ncbi:serine/threonine-protein kinase [Streptomyces spongiae]|uniref:PQQ-binding-like beta-propeller repeat protein n=1 Tax=Streptomyces spongiae TaxID=565072 RepID=A0A5N8XXW6_9ACTN|nr:serine/threonine-protein kinase [Streptomyces spongiae]MPY64213.1 PQQ-binding-like beta-propeller repeat protein [Streptomyces spongiae]
MAPQPNAGAGAEAELPEYAGHYRLESRLGSGGMGVVHLASSTSGLRLAVKVVHAEFAKDPEFRGRFRQEVGAARRVSGAFTAPVVDADPEAERPWMATLFIPGPTLADHVKRNGPMAPAQLRRLMAGLAEALRDIHRVGVVHRDLKPSNVLLAEDGPKVIDFGISRPKDSELRTETGKLIGTPPFMAPEQFRRPREVGPAADIFALGSVMVHASTGRGPFDSDSPYVVAYQVVHDEPDLTGVPENLAPLVLRCLAKEPEDRPTPDELMRGLRSVAALYDTQSFVPAQPADPAVLPVDPAVLPVDPGGLPVDPGGLPVDPGGLPVDPGGLAVDPAVQQADAADAGGDASKPRGDSPEGLPGAAEELATPRLRRRVFLATGAVVLTVGAALGSVQLLGGSGGAAESKDEPSRSASAAVRPWDTKPASANGDSAGASTPQCSYGAGKLLCAQPGLVSALDPADGSVLWRRSLGTGDVALPPVVSGGLVLVLADASRRLEALDPASGRTRWKQDVSAYNEPRFAGGMVLLSSADGTVTALDGASGTRKWRHPIPGHSEAFFTSFAGDRLAYMASAADDGSSTRVTAVDPVTGDVRWDARLKGSLQPVGSEGGRVFFAAVDNVYGATVAVVRYDPETRASRRVTLPVRLDQTDAIVRGDQVFLLAAGGSLVAVDMDARKQRWRLETSVTRGSTPVVDGRRLYFTAPDGRLLAVDAGTGRLLGQTSPRLGTHSDRVSGALPEPVAVGGLVCTGAPDGTVFAVDRDSPADW